MPDLFLAIIFTSWLVIAFRVFDLWKTDHLQAIIINYMVCSITGFFFYGNYKILPDQSLTEPWVLMAVLTGCFFLPTFYLMSFTVRKVSVTITSVANKTSLVIPVTVSLLFLDTGRKLSWMNVLGLGLGLLAIVLCSIKKKESRKDKSSPLYYFLPALVFLGGGLVDVMINITNYSFLPEDKSSLFPFFAFSASAFSGLLLLLFRIFLKGEKLQWKSIWGGLVLGIPNYLSIFFLLRALRHFDNNGALVFPVLNIAVIIVNTLIAVIFFRERPEKINYVGLLLAIVALGLVISH